MKEHINSRKGHYVLAGCLVIILAVILILPSQYQLYSQTIGKVVSVKEVATREITDEHGNQDQQTTQQLTIQVKNSTAKGKEFTLKNDYNQSAIASQRYKVNDKLFIDLAEPSGKALTGQIIGSKRDEKLVVFVALFMVLLFIVGGRAGLFALVSLVLNSGLMLLVLDYFIRGQTDHLVGAMLLVLPLLITGSLFLVNGWQLKTLAAILATFVGTLTAFVIGWLVVTSLNHQGLRYEEMDFLTRSPHAIFIASLLIGCLGAVMDVAMTIVATMFEVLEQQPNATLMELKQAGKQVGSDIVGPMSNVLLFSYLSGSLPLVLIYLRNQIDLTYTLSTILSLEIARALVGSLGIVLTVPIGIYSVLLVLKWQGVKA